MMSHCRPCKIFVIVSFCVFGQSDDLSASVPGSVSVLLKRHRRIVQSNVRSIGYLNTRDLYASEYYGMIEVGSPKRRFKVVLDTGSGNLILPSSDCIDPACLVHALYNAKDSATSLQIASADEPLKAASTGRARDSVNVTFGTGEMSGNLARDTVCLSRMCIEMDLIAASKVSDDPFEDAPFDGILGLALPQLAEAQEFSLMDSLVKAGSLTQNVFSVYFTHAENSEEQSEVLFGGIREERMASNISWIPVSNPGYWQIEMTDVLVGEARLNLCGSFACQVGLDTGTSMLAGPPRLIRQLAQKLQVAGDCSNFEELPDLGFLINGRTFSLKPSDYVDTAKGGCLLNLMALEVPQPGGGLTVHLFILGDPFLRRFYTVYDRERLRVGLALARHSESDGDRSASEATTVSDEVNV